MMKTALLLLVLLASTAQAEPMSESRYCLFWQRVSTATAVERDKGISEDDMISFNNENLKMWHEHANAITHTIYTNPIASQQTPAKIGREVYDTCMKGVKHADTSARPN